MLFEETKLMGAYVIRVEPIDDERGFFARFFCKEEFERMNLESTLVQSSISYNKKRYTVRGLHYQEIPHEEIKLVACRKGEIYDVIVDLRKGSPTYMQWLGIKLSSTNRKMLYIPKGFAHGFQTLEDETEVIYHMTVPYHPESAKGIRWNDPTLNINWPYSREIVISEKDKSFPDVHQ